MLLVKYRDRIAGEGELTCILGNSVGELSAVLAAKMISFTEAWNLVTHRGNLMEHALAGKSSGLTSGNVLSKAERGQFRGATEKFLSRKWRKW